MKKITILLSVLFLTSFTFKGYGAKTEPDKIPVFEMDTDGSKFYRIPVLITAQDGSLLAIADKRGDEIGDLPNTISVVAKRSTDNGVTWSDAIMIAEGNAAKEETYGDPAAVLDRNTGKLICIYAGDNGLWHSNRSKRMGFYISESSDNGLTWSEKRCITDHIYEKFNWHGAFAASGNALQLKDGRLMFVVAARHTPEWGGPLTNHACYSDDGGRTWNVSQGAGIGDEAKVVELENGDILMSVRNRGFRKFCRSTDRGETWGASFESTDLPEPACNGDIIRYPSKDGKTRILQTIPASSTIREKVSIYLSKDEGASWPVKKQLCDTLSAYSSIAILPDGSIGVLFEEGKWDHNLPGEDGFNLYFVRFALDWLEGNSDNP